MKLGYASIPHTFICFWVTKAGTEKKRNIYRTLRFSLPLHKMSSQSDDTLPIVSILSQHSSDLVFQHPSQDPSSTMWCLFSVFLYHKGGPRKHFHKYLQTSQAQCKVDNIRILLEKKGLIRNQYGFPVLKSANVSWSKYTGKPVTFERQSIA